MCNYRHPGPRPVWQVGSEPQFLIPLPPPRWPPPRIPKTLKLVLYASLKSSQGPATLSRDAQARELVRVAALPCTQEHHEINFRQKNTHDLEDVFFRVFPGRSQRPCFYNELSPSRRPSVHNFDSQLANSTSGPRGANGIQLGPNFTQSGSNLNPTG